MKFNPASATRFLFALLVVGAISTSVLGEKPDSKTAKKINWETANPAEIDLATIDIDRLDLSKETVKRIDLDKWDLSKIDVSKVKDPLSAKWIQKVLKEKKSLDKTLGSYRPGELEKLQQQNLHWLQKPPPLVEQKLSRNHTQSSVQIEKLAKQIDAVIESKLRESNGTFNPLTSDEQFVRRIYLDIAGRTPTAAEAQAFLLDRSANKRQALIDKLLLSPDYPSQMFNWVADMLRVRDLKSNQGENSSYQAWLMDQFTANRSWSKTVHDLMVAGGDLVTQPAVGWLVRDAGMPLDSLSNTLTTFLGANIACAQCHDHPFAAYTQRNFYELAAFFGSTSVPGKNVRGAPKVLKDRYHSVNDVSGKFLSLPDDYKYQDAKPGSQVEPAFPVLTDLAPSRSRSSPNALGREDFAGWLTNRRNEQFGATIANRLWGKAFGRAVMEPVTEMDNLDDPEKKHDPRLIHAIANLMQDLDFDLMAFQRVMFFTRAYQAQANPSPEFGDPYFFPGPTLRRMTAEQAWDSLATLAKGEAVNEHHRDRRTLTASYNVFKPGAVEAIEKGGKEHRLEFDTLIAEAGKMSERFVRESKDETGKRGKKADKGEGGANFARASERQQPEENKHFLRQFGQSPRELMDNATLEGSIPQVLMLMNSRQHEMLASADSYLMQGALKASRTEAERVDFVYLSFLSRRPSVAERAIISREKMDLNQLIWTLMNTREFIFVQ